MESHHHFAVQRTPGKRFRKGFATLLISSAIVSTSTIALFYEATTLEKGVVAPRRMAPRTIATDIHSHGNMNRMPAQIQQKRSRTSVHARGEMVSPESSPDPKKKEGQHMNSFLTNAITNSAEAFMDVLAGAKQCSNSQQCRRLHAFDDRVGPECCSFGVVNMCCFGSDDDDDFRGGFGRPLPPELQLEPALIPIPVHNPEQGYPRAGGGYGGGSFGGHPY